ncbi:MAG: hypothetical protein ILO53_09200 [Clostridia bacterium]|nr:hypothetical protein [Clostridia bacterium]
MDEFLEKPVKAILIANIVLSFIAAFSCFYVYNCKFIEMFFENVLPFYIYLAAAFVGFVLLAVFSILQLVLISERKKVSDDSKTRDDIVSTSTGWIDVNATSKKFRRSREYQSKARNTERFAGFVGVLIIILFLAVFAASAPPKTVIEFTKKPVDRLISDFRVISDLVFQAFFAVTVILYITVAPKIVSGERSLGKVSSIVLSVIPIAACVRFGYFYFGNILAFPSPVDFAIFGLSALTAGLFIFSGYAAGRQKMIRDLTAR